MLIEADWAGRPDMKVLCGGEALTVELARQLQQRAGQVWNVYGPTETTIWSSVVHLEDELDMVTIGRPIANTHLYILDKNLQPVPRGAVGVLYIGGDGLAQGYLNQPELTAEKFVVNPFSDYPARMYNTGDLARYLPDGQVECLGRVDSQVKIRGFRIELGEIEAMIDQHQEVVQNAVVVREDGGEKNLVAYIVPEQAEQLTADNLRSFLMKRLPYYMIPTIFATIEVLPMTPNGKVDRKALPAPDQNRLGQEQGFVAPSTPAETSIAGIWKELLDVEQIGVHDDFFALGGHSILAIRAITRMRDILETDLALGALFEHPTVASIAEFIEAMNLLESTEPSEALLDVEMEETEI